MVQDLLGGAGTVVLDYQVDMLVGVAETDQDPPGLGVPDHVGQSFAGKDVKGLF